MAALTVFYDARCAFCRLCRAWLEKQPAFLPIVFVPYQAPQATILCPRLAEFHPDQEIVVMSDSGAIYTGAAAWVMCLYATRRYRELSLRLAHPALMPFARKVCHLVSQNRHNISALFKKHPEDTARDLDALPAGPVGCHSGTCATSTPTPPPLPK